MCEFESHWCHKEEIMPRTKKAVSLTKQVEVPLDTYVSVSRILEIIAEQGGDVDSAEIQTRAYMGHNSYGDGFAEAEVSMTFLVPNPQK